MKNCLLLLREKIDHLKYIEQLCKLNHFTLTIKYNKDDFEAWYKTNPPNKTVLVVYEGNQEYLESNLLIYFPNAYFLWVAPKQQKLSLEREYVEQVNNLNDIRFRLMHLFKFKDNINLVPEEFIYRVIKSSHKNEEEIEEVEVEQIEETEKLQENEKTQKVNKEEPKEQYSTKKVNPKTEKNIEINPNSEVKKEAVVEIENKRPSQSTQKSDKENQELNSYTSIKSELYKRSRLLQTQIFKPYKRNDHKTIGIWSPIYQMGVTTLTMNFAFFLGKHKLDTVVLEGVSEQYNMKDWLKRYTLIPTNWQSLGQALHQENSSLSKNIDWIYKNVRFFPLDTEDEKLEWNEISLELYMTTTKIVDITLVDLPTGKMGEYTLKTLPYLDELWILVDDHYQKNISWKKYIVDLKKSTKIPFYLIFNKAFPFSQSERISRDLNIPLITTVPSLHEELALNNYENFPIYDKEEVVEKLQPSFLELAKHLLGERVIENFSKDPVEDSSNNSPAEQKKWWTKILKPLNEL